MNPPKVPIGEVLEIPVREEKLKPYKVRKSTKIHKAVKKTWRGYDHSDRNLPCPCGSGFKFKLCCMKEKLHARRK